jgi:CHAT domain-containing protein
MKKKYLIFSILLCFFGGCKAKKERNVDFDQWIWQNIVKKGDFAVKDSILKYTLAQAKLQLPIEDTAIATLYHKMGANYQSNGYLNEALLYLDAALRIRTRQLPANHRDILRSQVVKGVTLVNKLEYTNASILLEKTLKNLLEAPKSDSVFMGYAYKNLAQCYDKQGEWVRALEMYQQALQYIQSSESNYSKCLMDMGVVCDLLKQTENSKTYYEKALNWFLENQDSFYVAHCYHNLAMLQLAQNPTAGLQSFEKALRFYDKESVESANTLLEMAKCYKAVQQLVQAETLTHQSLQIRKKNYKHKHYAIAESYTFLAELSAVQNDFSTALNHYQQAIDAYDTLTFTPVQRIEPLFGKAKMLLGLARNTEALIVFNALDSLIQEVTHQFKEDKSKFTLLENHFGIYEKAIQTAYEQFKITQDAALLLQAFQWSAHSKAVALRQAMHEEKAKQFAGIPKDILKEERSLKEAIAFQQKALNDAPNDKVIRQQLFEAKEKWHQFVQTLESKYQNYHHLKYAENQPFNVLKLQQSLPKEMICLEFFVGDSTIFTFAMTQQQLKIYSIATPVWLDSMIIQLRESLITPNAQLKNTYLTNAYSMYQWLLETPLKALNPDQKKTRLRIIPDGKLGYIPFDALLTQPATDWDDKRSQKVPYLLRSYATSYSYFADSVLNSEVLKIKNNFCGFGIDYRDSLTNRTLHHKLGYLDHAPKEVDSIQQFIGGKTWKNRVATKNCFLQQATQCGILHLSMHSMTDDKNPLEAQLIFSKRDSADDNLLTGNELFAQQFRCGLAVLSACQTGSGKLQRGEGVMSLARAFAYSGCPSLVMSLWSIPDRSTSNIMLHFYQNLKQNLPKDVALQRSKLQYLDNQTFEPSQKMPNFWAATVIIGDVNALVFERWYEKFGLILGIMLLSLLWRAGIRIKWDFFGIKWD